MGQESPLIADVLPRYDVESHHTVLVRATVDEVYRQVVAMDLSRSALIRTLFRIRGLPASALNAEGLASMNFKVVAEEPGKSLVLGIVGKFWTPGGRLLDFNPIDFPFLHTKGFARAIWAFDLVPEGEGKVRVNTYTRVSCPDAYSRRRFRMYWFVIGPFSGLIRRAALGLIKKNAEAGSTSDRDG